MGQWMVKYIPYKYIRNLTNDTLLIGVVQWDKTKVTEKEWKEHTFFIYNTGHLYQQGIFIWPQYKKKEKTSYTNKAYL